MAAMTTPASPAAPDACGVAFKEWKGVCDALADGRQSLILRKGGIDEGPGGFTPEHRAFWLYPTRVHQAQQGLKETEPDGGPPPETAEGTIGLDALAVVEVIGQVDRPERLRELDDLHVWTAETVEKRFHYRKPGLWVLGVRVYRRAEPVLLAVTPEHAGCKTWVPLDPPVPTAGLAPVLDESTFLQRMDRLRSVFVKESPADHRPGIADAPTS
jgi:hypothetical protein